MYYITTKKSAASSTSRRLSKEKSDWRHFHYFSFKKPQQQHAQ
jgi:hypothetical protein